MSGPRTRGSRSGARQQGVSGILGFVLYRELWRRRECDGDTAVERMDTDGSRPVLWSSADPLPYLVPYSRCEYVVCTWFTSGVQGETASNGCIRQPRSLRITSRSPCLHPFAPGSAAPHPHQAKPLRMPAALSASDPGLSRAVGCPRAQ